MQRNAKIINLRVLAILVVIFGHCIIIYDPSWREMYGYHNDYDSTIFYNIKMVINMFQMELFYAISGFCFYYTVNKGKSFKNITKDKTERILIPYTCIAIVWLIPLRFLFQYPNYADKNIMGIISDIILVKDIGHLWFLPVLFLLFIGASLIKGIKNIYVMEAILIASLFMSAFSSIMASFLPKMFCKYFFFFYAGYFINTLINTKSRNILAFSLTAGLLLSVILASVYKLGLQHSLWTCCRSLILCGLIAFAIPGSTVSIIEYLDRKSFGLYLLHSPLLILGYRAINYPPHFYLPFQLIFSITISLCTIYIMKKCKLHFMLGEKNG